MQMDFNTIAIIVLGVVILGGLALWLGRGLKIRKDKDGFSLETEATQIEGRSKSDQNISVGKDLEIEGSTAGDVAGIKGDTDSDQDIDVLSGGKVKDSNLGDIVGIKKENDSSKEKK